MKLINKIIFFLVIAFPTMFLDQATKIWAQKVLKFKPTMYYAWNTIQLRYAENKGAWGSLGNDWPYFIKIFFLIILPIIILIGLLIYILINKNVSKVYILAFSLIWAGGFGNIIDRIRFDYVVDFLYMGIGPVGTNIFNVADVVVVIGSILFLCQNYIEWKTKKTETLKKAA